LLIEAIGAIGAIGAAYIVRNARTGRVEWANFLGACAEFRSDRITQFTVKDPFTELLAGHEGTWMRLSEHSSAPELRRNEWYNDFVLKGGGTSSLLRSRTLDRT